MTRETPATEAKASNGNDSGVPSTEAMTSFDDNDVTAQAAP